MIAEGKLGVGEKIPADEELAAQHHCSRGTVRRAIQALVEEGLLDGRQGSGTFVQHKSRERLIGVIVPNVKSPEHSHLVSAITSSAAKRGCSVLLSIVEEHREPDQRVPVERQFIAKLGRLHAAGAVKCPTTLEMEPEFHARFHALHVPLVVVNDFWSDGEDADHILFDEAAAARMAVEYLAGLGHRRIAFFSRPHGNLRPHARDAFLEAIKAGGLPSDAGQVIEAEYESLIESVCAGGSAADVTGVVIPYYTSSCAIVEKLEAAGLRVPEDLSIMSLGGVPDSGEVQRDLTATVAPVDAMAACALETLLAPQKGYGATHWSRFLFKPTLHVGKSTAPPREREKKRAEEGSDYVETVDTGVALANK